MKYLLAALACTFASASSAHAEPDWKDLVLDGYSLAARTSVNGEFQGCDYDRRVPLTNGYVFVCTSYNYSYSYGPDVFILRNGSGRTRVIIDDDEYEGYLVRP